MIGVTPIAAVSLITYAVITNDTYCAHVILLPNSSAVISAVSISCDTAVDPVARSDSMRLPVARLIRKKIEMSTRFAVRNATIDDSWIRVACVNTTSNSRGVTPFQPGAVVTLHHA